MSKQERILAAALETISEKGPHETTIDEIAQRAGVAKGTVYLYFRNKDSLLSSLMQMGLDNLESAILARVNAESEPVEQLKVLISEHVTQTYKHITLAKVLWQQASNVALPLELKQEFLVRLKRQVDLVEGILKKGQAAHRLTLVDARVTARAIIGSLNRAVFDLDDPGSSPDSDVIIKTITHMILDGLVRTGGN